MVTTSDSRSRVSLDTSSAPTFPGALGRQILTPGEHPHAERLANLGHPRTEPAKPEDPERLVLELLAETDLPLPFSGRSILGGNETQTRKDEPPGELSRREGPTARTAHRDPVLGSRLEIDCGVAHTRSDEQLEIRQPCEEGTSE